MECSRVENMLIAAKYNSLLYREGYLVCFYCSMCVLWFIDHVIIPQIYPHSCYSPKWGGTITWHEFGLDWIKMSCSEL